jgi:hypothetical protein
MVANVEFHNVGAYVYGDATQLARGPAVEGQHTFWVYFYDCAMGGLGTNAVDGNPAIGLDAAQRGAAWTTIQRNDASGGFNIYHSVASGGGYDATGGASSWNFTVADLTVEGDFVHPILPAVRLRNSNGIVNVNLSDLVMADGSGTAVVVDPNLNARAESVICNYCGSVSGPVTVLSRYPSSSVVTSLAANGGVGFENGRIVGRTDAARRLGGPVAVQYSNLVTGEPSSSGTLTVTPGAPGPFGGSGALSLSSTYSGIDEVTIPTGTITVSVGDRLVFGGWVRADSSAGVPSPLIVNPGGSGFTFSADLSSPSFSVANKKIAGDREWEWIVGSAKYATVGTNPASPVLNVRADLTHPMTLYAPILMRIPAAVSDNEAAEIILHLGQVPKSATPGVAHLPPGIPLGLDGKTISTGAGDPEGVVTAGQGSIHLRTDGGASTTLYVKTSGSGNTGWSAK